MKRIWIACIVVGLTAILATTGYGATILLDDFEEGSGEEWFYQNNPGDGEHEGGFGQDPPDTTADVKTPLQIVTDPCDPNNKVLKWTFDGSLPNAEPNSASYFDVFLKMPAPEDWTDILGIRFDVKVTSSAANPPNCKLYARLDNNDTRPIDDPCLFGDDDRVWQANLDVPKNDPDWHTFVLYFDNVTDVSGYLNQIYYNIQDEFANSIIVRDQLESFRLSTYLSDTLIGSDEIMTIYFDNVELIEFGPPLNTSMSNVIASENSWGPFLIYRNLVETRAGSSPGAYGDWEIGLRTEEGGFAPVVQNNNYIWPNASDPETWPYGEPNNTFVLTFTKETGTIDFTLGYAPTLSYDYAEYAGMGMDKVYLMAKSDGLDRTCTINNLKVNGTKPQHIADLVGIDTQTYATIRDLDYEDFTLTGSIVFSYEDQAEHSEIEALFAFGTPGPEPEGPNDIWTLVDKASIVAEGPEENPWVIKLESLGDEAPPWASVLFMPPEPMTFNDVNELSSDFDMTEGSFGGGSPRFSLLIDWNDSHVIDSGDKYAFIHWGTPPDYMDVPVHNSWYVEEQDPNWAERNNTGNIVDVNDHRVDLTQFGGPFYSTIEEAKNLFGDKEVLEIILVLDGSWLHDQVLLVDNIKVRTYTGIYTTYLYDANPLGPEPAEPGDGDLNLDGEVTVPDLWLLLRNWLRQDCLVEECDNADLAPDVRDGNINDFDFAVMAMHWLEGVQYDLSPPEPNVMTWASEPNAIAGAKSITMTATTATDPSGVQYYFKNVTLPTHNSTWQQSPTYVDTDLDSGTQYTYQVKARDMALNINETQYSAPASAVAQGNLDEIEIEDIFISIPRHDARLADNGVGTGDFVDYDDSDNRALRLGDYNTNQGYRMLLSFDTSSIPTDATILSAKVRLTCGAKEGTSPFDGWGGSCVIDIASPYFGTKADPEKEDWHNAADADAVAEFTTDPGPENPIVSTDFNAAGQDLINTYGSTQLRVRFTVPRSPNGRSDLLGFYAAEEEGPTSPGQPDRRPQFIVRYLTRTPTMAISGIDPDHLIDGRMWDNQAGVGAGGNSADNNGGALRIGDYSDGESYRILLSFDTSVFPENYTIEQVMLKLARGAHSYNDNPFNWGGTCNVDLANPYFHNSEVMEPEDWHAPATAAAVAIFSDAPMDPNEGDYMISGRLNAEGRMNINLNGLTQFRVRFTNLSNGGASDYLGFWPAEAIETRKPKLLIEYSID